MDLSLHVTSAITYFLSIVAFGGSQIINKNVIGDNDSFIMTCNLASFKGIELPETKYFSRLKMYRQVDGTAKEEFIGMLESAIMDKDIDPLIRSIPEGRQLEYTYGGMNAKRNLETVFVSLNVKDASKTDVGFYWCVGEMHGTSAEYQSNKFDLRPLDVEGSQIINKYVIGNNDNFIMTCRDLSFSDLQLPGMKYYARLLLYRKLLSADQDEFLGMISDFVPESDRLFRKIPEGRQWEYRYGGLNGATNKRTIFLSLIVKDASKADAGLYWCGAQVPGNNYNSTKFNLIAQGAIVLGNPIINKNVIASRDSFTMTCNAASFRDTIMPRTTYFSSLMMYRQSEMQPQDQEMGTYNPFTQPNLKPLTTKIPEGRNWEFSYGGGSGTLNRETIWMSVKVQDATCADAGIYRCVATIAHDNTPYNSTFFRLNGKMKEDTIIDPIKVTPSRGGGPRTSYNNQGDNVSMQCTYSGAENLRTSWSLNDVDNINNDFVINVPPELIKDKYGCPTYSYKSIKSALLHSSTERNLHFCKAMNELTDEAEAVTSMQFLFDKEVPAPTQATDDVRRTDVWSTKGNSGTIFEKVETVRPPPTTEYKKMPSKGMTTRNHNVLLSLSCVFVYYF